MIKIAPRVKIAPNVQKHQKISENVQKCLKSSKTHETFKNVQHVFPQPPSRETSAAAAAAAAAAVAAVVAAPLDFAIKNEKSSYLPRPVDDASGYPRWDPSSKVLDRS